MTKREVEYETTVSEELSVCDECGMAVESGDEAISYTPDPDDAPPLDFHERCLGNVTLSEDYEPKRKDTVAELADYPIKLALDGFDTFVLMVFIVSVAALASPLLLEEKAIAVIIGAMSALYVLAVGTGQAQQPIENLSK